MNIVKADKKKLEIFRIVILFLTLRGIPLTLEPHKIFLIFEL